MSGLVSKGAKVAAEAAKRTANTAANGAKREFQTSAHKSDWEIEAAAERAYRISKIPSNAAAGGLAGGALLGAVGVGAALVSDEDNKNKAAHVAKVTAKGAAIGAFVGVTGFPGAILGTGALVGAAMQLEAQKKKPGLAEIADKTANGFAANEAAKKADAGLKKL